MPGKHAKLSASGAERWLACPPSASLESTLPESSSSFAEEGTAAHSLAEIMLTLKLVWDGKDKKVKKKLDTRLAAATKGKYYNAEMQDYIDKYVDWVTEEYHASLAEDPATLLLLEERLDFSEWVPGGFGTGDVLILSSKIAKVIDLKYGKGVVKEAEGNPQARLYGLGAVSGYSMIYDFNEVRSYIVQVRLDTISTETLHVGALLAWGEDIVRPRALLADKGEGEFCAGSHCKFCKIKGCCRTRAEKNQELAAFDFVKPPHLEPSEISEILGSVSALVSWAEDVKHYAQDQAENHGVRFPGYKLVEGRSTRVLTEVETVVDILRTCQYNEDEIFNMKMKGLGDLDKLLGKKLAQELIGKYIIKPPGKLTLVPEADKRPEASSTASAQNDFETAGR